MQLQKRIKPKNKQEGRSHRSKRTVKKDALFGNITISKSVSRALDEMGYTKPTEIQLESIPILSKGNDVVGKAQTGTGKTTAFGIPLVQSIDPTKQVTQGIILVPTRELASQVSTEIRKLSEFLPIRTIALYGGQSINKQITDLRKTPHIIVGTPGRILDHISRGTIKLNNISFAILDEADQMLDIGFAEDMVKIIGFTPRTRQTALFSATIPRTIKRLISRFLRNPSWIQVGAEIDAADTIKQIYYEVADQDKFKGLSELLSYSSKENKALVFCRTQIGVDRLTKRLRNSRFDAKSIHGGMSQSQRERVIRDYRSGTPKILVATNLAARGLDIPEISYVINYNMPGNIEEYVHRIGRTGRIGNLGTAITFVGEDDFNMMGLLAKRFGENLKKGRLNLYKA
tara:strand:+ start:2067 stop:3269 length:1203 start_codon:yes stop_codon:yes gene_type:complete